MVTFDEDNFPVRRGSVVQLDNRKALVWCHGVTDAVIRGWRYYQGKRHIPAPLLLQRHAGSTSLESLCGRDFRVIKDGLEFRRHVFKIACYD